MNTKFKYVGLIAASAIGGLVALAVHHELRKAQAKAFISKIKCEHSPLCDKSNKGNDDVVVAGAEFEFSDGLNKNKASDEISEKEDA